MISYLNPKIYERQNKMKVDKDINGWYVEWNDKSKSYYDSFYSKGHYSGVMKRKKDDGFRHPQSILPFNSVWRKGMHPTEKPIELFEWLIKSYSQEGDLVLDNCIGSGTTAVACINTNRKYIGFELDKSYFDIANKRIEEAFVNKGD